MDDTNKPAAPEASAMALPLFCPRDGDILYAGTKTIATTTFNAWLCPTCDYWKIRTGPAAASNENPA